MKVFNNIATIVFIFIMGYTVFTGGAIEDIILAAVLIIMIWVGEIADDVTQILKLKKKEVKVINRLNQDNKIRLLEINIAKQYKLIETLRNQLKAQNKIIGKLKGGGDE